MSYFKLNIPTALRGLKVKKDPDWGLLFVKNLLKKTEVKSLSKVNQIKAVNFYSLYHFINK
jgi:hypothetical protein